MEIREDLYKLQDTEYGDFQMLFTGDIEEVAEKAILNKYGKSSEQILNSTVLKVAHHRIKNIFK